MTSAYPTLRSETARGIGQRLPVLGSQPWVPEPRTEPRTVVELSVVGNATTSTDAAVPSSVSNTREPGTAPYFDVAALLDGTMPEPPRPTVLTRTDGHSVFYRGQVNLVFGDPESGKTWVCLAAAVEALSKGGRAIIIDLDHNGPASTVVRLRNLGAPTDALRDPARFLYVEPDDRLDLLQVVADMGEWKPSVAVVDSIGELLPLFGSSSNSADEFTTVHSRVLKPLAKSGAAVLAVDHLAKGQDSREKGPGGTMAKRRAIGGVSLRVKAKEQFTPGKGGSATLTVNKDRHGGLRQFCQQDSGEQFAGMFRLDAFVDDVLEWSVRAPGNGERVDPSVASVSDVAAAAALDPPPTTVEDARARLNWSKQRTTTAVRTWRAQSEPR